MKEYLMEWKAAIAAFFMALGAFLGWQGVMAVVWVVVMAIDYITGTAAAIKAKDWSSAVARQGLWHKGGMIAVVVVSGIADSVMVIICEHLPIGIAWTCIILPLVLAWYIVTELGSILENAVRMGAAVPAWLVKLLRASLKAVEDQGTAVEDEAEILINDYNPKNE